MSNSYQPVRCSTKASFIEALETKHGRAYTLLQSRRRRLEDTAPLNLHLTVVETDNELILCSGSDDKTHSISVPLPYVDDNGNNVVGEHVKRSVGSWFLVDPVAGLPRGQEINYWGIIEFLLLGRIENHISYPGVSRKIQWDRLLQSYLYNNTPLVARQIQRIINTIVNDLPVCGTPAQTWAMNNRVVFIDPAFDALPPQEVLDYQEEKNRLFFPWSSIGLSDSSMVKNYLIKVDLRNYTPFARKHHNPMRNLYQALSMEGDESPWVTTESAQKLAKGGCERTGHNLMTCFLDLPLTFEDQLILSTRLLPMSHAKIKEFICFGTPAVIVGDLVNYGDILSNEPSNNVLVYNSHADSSVVKEVYKDEVVFDGSLTKIHRVIVESKRTLKSGSKFTNLHGNKGVAVFMETGTVYDAIRKQDVDIDVIVSAKTVGNRRNFGQILEALLTMVKGPGKQIVLTDDVQIDIEQVSKKLVSLGANEDGTSVANTPWGTFSTICGWVFWGLVKDPEDALWVKNDVRKRDSIGIRTSGVKISHIEMRALITNTGDKSAILKEILSYQEGADVIQQYLSVVKSMRGELPSVPIVDIAAFRSLEQTSSFFHSKGEFSKTLFEEERYKDGLVLELPLYYVSLMPNDKSKHIIEKVMGDLSGLPPRNEYKGRIYVTKHIYVPFWELRAPWQHQTGKWGLSDVGGLLNNILLSFEALKDEGGYGNCCRTLKAYFHNVSDKLTTKRGALATFGMSVRYPNAAKATAVMTDTLSPNTVQIPSQMAKELGVDRGDVVLVERFPCLGFMSLRAQRVEISDAPLDRYVVKVSANSLNSLNLDFDGDVLFLMSFKSKEANEELKQLLEEPPPLIHEFLEQARLGKTPFTGTATLTGIVAKSLKNALAPLTFQDLSPEISATISRALVGIKIGTGSCVALGYNVLRIGEGAKGLGDKNVLVGTERALNAVANSVFSVKHHVLETLERGA